MVRLENKSQSVASACVEILRTPFVNEPSIVHTSGEQVVRSTMIILTDLHDIPEFHSGLIPRHRNSLISGDGAIGISHVNCLISLALLDPCVDSKANEDFIVPIARNVKRRCVFNRLNHGVSKMKNKVKTPKQVE